MLATATSLETGINVQFAADGLGITTSVQTLSAPQAVGSYPSQPNVLPAIIGGVGGTVGVLFLGLFAYCVWCKKSAEKKAAAPPVQPPTITV